MADRFAPREVTVGGIVHPSVAAAALALGLSESAVRYRLQRGIPLDAPLSQVRQARAVVVNGAEYPSINRAAKAIGISHTAMRFRLSNERMRQAIAKMRAAMMGGRDSAGGGV